MAKISASNIVVYNGSAWVSIKDGFVKFFNGSAWVSAYDGGGVAIYGGDGNFYCCPVFSSAVNSLFLKSGVPFGFSCTMSPVGVISVVGKPAWLTVSINGNTVEVEAEGFTSHALFGILKLSCSNGAPNIVLDIELVATGDI